MTAHQSAASRWNQSQLPLSMKASAQRLAFPATYESGHRTSARVVSEPPKCTQSLPGRFLGPCRCHRGTSTVGVDNLQRLQRGRFGRELRAEPPERLLERLVDGPTGPEGPMGGVGLPPIRKPDTRDSRGRPAAGPMEARPARARSAQRADLPGVLEGRFPALICEIGAGAAMLVGTFPSAIGPRTTSHSRCVEFSLES